MPPRSSSRAASKPASKPASKKATPKPAAKPKSGSKAKSASKEDEEEAKPASKAKAATKKAAPKKAAPKTTKAKPAPKKQKKEEVVEESEEEADEDAEEEVEESEPESEAEEEKPAQKPAANGNGPKRGRSTTAEPKKPAPVKRRRTGKLLNEIAQAPEPQGLSVFVWGTGDMGQFGTGPDDLDEKPRPQLHEWFEEQREEGKLGSAPGKGGIERIAAGGMHSLAINELGQVHSWGINDNAALGRETANIPDPANLNSTLPAEDFETWPFIVEALEKDGFRAVKVAAGDSVSVALSDKGELRAWGSFRSNDGVLGFDGVPGHAPFQFVPIELHALARVEVVDVACGADHVLALTSDGFVYVWGNGQQNQLGRRVMERRRLNGLEPERLGLRNIVHVAAGMYHSFAVDKDGKVWAWGLNTYKQTGLEDEDEMVLRPVQVQSLAPSEHNGARVIQASGGEHHSLFLFDDGSVWGCGRQDANELGLCDDHPAQEGLKERREELRAEKQDKVDRLKKRVEEVNDDPKADDEDKQAVQLKLAEAEASLRIPNGEYVPEPVRIVFPPIPEEYAIVPEMEPYSDKVINPIANISAGTRHNLAVSRSGHVYAWGLGLQGQLGLGANTETVSTPSVVRSKQLRPYDAVSASAGGQHCVLIAKKRDAVDE